MAGLALQSARWIAEKVLQRIGAFTVNANAAESHEIARVLDWMSLVLGYRAGTTRIWWFVPSPIEFPCPEVTAPPYDLLTEMAGNAPENGFMYPIAARIRESNGKETPVRLAPRYEFMDLAGRPNSGTPESIYIDHHARTPQLWIDPVPALDADMTIVLDCVVCPEAPNPATVAQKALGEVKLDVSQEFYLWLILETAYQCGSGPVRNLPMDERKQLFDEAEAKWNKLAAWRIEDTSDRPRRTAAWGR